MHNGKVNNDQFGKIFSMQAVDYYIDLNLPQISKENLVDMNIYGIPKKWHQDFYKFRSLYSYRIRRQIQHL